MKAKVRERELSSKMVYFVLWKFIDKSGMIDYYFDNLYFKNRVVMKQSSQTTVSRGVYAQKKGL